MASELNSPLPKKVKSVLENSSYSQSDQPQLMLFNNAFFEQNLEENVKHMIDKYYSTRRDIILSVLENANIELPDSEIPNLDEISKNLDCSMEKLKSGLKNLKQQIKEGCDMLEILAILQAKKNCPISQIIDNL